MSWFWFDNRVMISKIRISTYKSIQRGDTKCEQCNRDNKGTEITVKKKLPRFEAAFSIRISELSVSCFIQTQS